MVVCTWIFGEQVTCETIALEIWRKLLTSLAIICSEIFYIWVLPKKVKKIKLGISNFYLVNKSQRRLKFNDDQFNFDTFLSKLVRLLYLIFHSQGEFFFLKKEFWNLKID